MKQQQAVATLRKLGQHWFLTAEGDYPAAVQSARSFFTFDPSFGRAVAEALDQLTTGLVEADQLCRLAVEDFGLPAENVEVARSFLRMVREDLFPPDQSQ